MTDENTTPTSAAEDPAVLDAGQATPPPAAADAERTGGAPVQYGVGPFSVREVALAGVWLVAFIVSFFSLWSDLGRAGAFVAAGSVWTSGIDWILTIGVPTVAVFLIVLRRFSPDGIRRVGSLAVDQFASVAFSVSALVWLGILWGNIARGIQTGIWLSSWVVWVEVILMAAGVVLTVFAPFIAPFDEDFRGRAEVAAHRNARPVRAVSPRPVAPRPAAEPQTAPDFSAQPAAPSHSDTAYGGEPRAGAAYEPVAYDPASPRDGSYDSSSATSLTETAAFELIESEPVDAEPVAQPAGASQAFWALAPVEREIVDENGLPLFSIGPTAWALVIEDRGDVFVVRHEDGRVGYLTDVSGVTRG